MIEALGGLLSTLGGTFAEKAGDVWGWLVTATEAVVTTIGNILGAIGTKISEVMGGIPAAFWNWVTGGSNGPAPAPDPNAPTGTDATVLQLFAALG
jgi:hypothetical protein